MRTSELCSPNGTVSIGWYPLMRVSHAHPFVMVPAGNPLRFKMHWVPGSNRTLPCHGEDCAYCSQGDPARPLAYCPVMKLAGDTQGPCWNPCILELPYGTYCVLGQFGHCAMQLQRIRKQGMIEVRRVTLRCQMPTHKDLNIFPSLLRLWRFPAATALTSFAVPDTNC
jgi:hypothetical protein